MSLKLLPECSSPTPAGVITGTDLCDGGVATASEEVEAEVIHATAGFSGGRQISVRHLRNETPAYQLRQEIARSLNVDSDRVVLIKGATVVDDSSPDEFGPFCYVLKEPSDDRSRELMRMIVAGNQRDIDHSKEKLRKEESWLRIKCS